MSARVVRWSKAVCALLSESGPMTPSRAAKTLVNGPAADLFFCVALASPHLHLEHPVDLQRVVEIQDLRFPGF